MLQNKLESNIKTEIGQSLHTILKTTQRAVHSWLDGHLHDLLLRSNSTKVQRLTKQLVQFQKTHPTKSDLLMSPAQHELRLWLNTITEAMGYVDYIIFGPDNINLASSRNEYVGEESPLIGQAEFFTSVWAGKPTLSMPIKSPQESVTGDNRHPTMFVAAPIYDGKNVIAVFAFGIDAEKEFSVIFEAGRMGLSGETYAFDKQGWLISESRFVSELRSLGLLANKQKSILNVQLSSIELNSNVAAQNKSSPMRIELTQPVKSALRGESGVELQGVADYRGVNVLATWLWDSELNMGMITEQGVNEAYKTLRNTTNIITGLTVISMVLIIIVSLFYNFGRRKLVLSRQALESSEIQLRSIIDSSADGIITFDKNRIIQTFSFAAEKIFGYQANNILGEPFDQLVESSDLPRVIKYLSLVPKMSAADEFNNLELQGLRKNSFGFDMELSVGYTDLAEESIFIGIIRDITARKRVENALQQSELKYRTLIENLQEGIWVINAQGYTSFVNKSMCTMLKCTEEEMLQKPYESFISGDNEKVIRAKLQEKNIKDKGQYEIELVTRDKLPIYTRMTTASLSDERGLYVGLIAGVVDLTQRKLLETQGRRQMEMLAHAARTSAVGEMSSGMAHELNQPLAAIFTYAKTCLRMMQTNKYDVLEIRNILENITQQADRASQLIRRFRKFVRKEKYVEIESNIREIVDESFHIVENQIRSHNIDVQYTIENGLPIVNVDPIQIQQVLVNLLQNAIESIVESGNVDRLITIEAVLKKDFIEVSVANKGVGLSDEDKMRLFEPFFTTKKDGLGLGLAISQSIIFLHGGKLWVSTSDDETRFHFNLPIAAKNKDVTNKH